MPTVSIEGPWRPLGLRIPARDGSQREIETEGEGKEESEEAGRAPEGHAQMEPMEPWDQNMGEVALFHKLF